VADYPLGQQIVIDRTFFEDEVLVDPATVTLLIELPSGTEVEYEFGVDVELTNPSTGYYLVEAYLPPSPGTYNYRWQTTDPHVVAEGAFTVATSALGAVTPTTGPCEPWVTAEDVADYCGTQFTGGSDTSVLEEWASIASDVLFQITGGTWPGECGPIVVRPCADACGCWAIAANRYAQGWAWDPSAGRWNCGGRSCGCSPLSEVQLTGNPRSIIEVKIDGAVVPSDEYRLDTQGRLVRLRDPLEPNSRLLWPSCQILDLADTEEGTFSIEYTYGADPPHAGRVAAAALACQLWLARNNNGRCKLPQNTRSVVRGGMTIEIGSLIADSLKRGATGILAIDAFIAAYAQLDAKGNPIEESTVWSPDIPPYPRRMV
jgi:hypothetical protein